METASPTTALDQMLAPLGDFRNTEVARRIIALRIAPHIPRRIEELADRGSESVLTGAERVEYGSDVEGAGIVGLVTLKARQFLISKCSG